MEFNLEQIDTLLSTTRAVRRAIQFSSSIPMRTKACVGWAANRRHAVAMLV